MSLADDIEHSPWDSDCDDWTPREERNNRIHATRDGIDILIKDMSDKHLFNSAMMMRGDKYFKEIVYRLFERQL